ARFATFLAAVHPMTVLSGLHHEVARRGFAGGRRRGIGVDPLEDIAVGVVERRPDGGAAPVGLRGVPEEEAVLDPRLGDLAVRRLEGQAGDAVGDGSLRHAVGDPDVELGAETDRLAVVVAVADAALVAAAVRETLLVR